MKRLLLMLSFALLAANLTQAQDFDRREYRAVWLTTFLGLDWPKGHDPLTQQKQLCRILDQLQAAKVNTVLFQVRLRGTTAYDSDIEPWDGIFTGTPGRRPTYDPLAFAIKECHRRGMELHAWMVAFPVCKLNVLKALGTKSVVRKHPELCRRSDDQYI
ncbi:MAG: family 10 glycosylhydrolase, partial [Alloprevotella tannerae]|nr:family 10 glycosylhydrolase [Alloprevotella tannerae]